MNGKYLLDTNIAVRVLNQDLDLEPRRGSGIELWLCLTVVGELLFGAERSGRPEANRGRVERLVDRCPVIFPDLETAERYGAVKARLRQAGRPIPENDIWIAACALQHGLTLITRDQHFDHVIGLRTEAW